MRLVDAKKRICLSSKLFSLGNLFLWNSLLSFAIYFQWKLNETGNK
ncbi:hypothetical protein M2133_002130 [Parabacteroides sp. PF5-6]|nr:hypothetical protein [Parabacteroides sp. PF5-6]